MKKQVYKVVQDCSCCELRIARHCLLCKTIYHPSPLKPKKDKKKKYCGGDHCTMLWNLPCSEDHGLPKKSKKKMYKYKTFCENCHKKKEIDIPYGKPANDYLPALLQVCKFCGCY